MNLSAQYQSVDERKERINAEYEQTSRKADYDNNDSVVRGALGGGPYDLLELRLGVLEKLDELVGLLSGRSLFGLILIL